MEKLIGEWSDPRKVGSTCHDVSNGDNWDELSVTSIQDSWPYSERNVVGLGHRFMTSKD